MIRNVFRRIAKDVLDVKEVEVENEDHSHNEDDPLNDENFART